MGEAKPKREKFKYTRELVKIAVDDGMTQVEVGNLCRVEQSVVSGWLAGKYRAFDHQIAPLLKRYGSRLNRTTSRVYLVESEARPDETWKETEIGKRLWALAQGDEPVEEEADPEGFDETDELAHEPRKERPETDAQRAMNARLAELSALRGLVVGTQHADNGWADSKFLLKAYEADMQLRANPARLVLVDGPIVLRYAFCKLMIEPRPRGPELVRVPQVRWMIHHQGPGRFALVRQRQRKLAGSALWRWGQEVQAHRGSVGSLLNFEGDRVECPDDSAKWICRIQPSLDAEALIQWTDAYLADRTTFHGPHDEAVVPFLVRKMLIEHGYPVEGVERLTGGE